MANVKVKVKSKDADGNTKLQDITGWNQNNLPAITVIGTDAKSRLKVNNGSELTVNEWGIKASNNRFYCYIAAGPHTGKYVKYEDLDDPFPHAVKGPPRG